MYLPCSGGKCISSKSPWTRAISQNRNPKLSHDRKKLIEKINRTYRHFISKRVVKISWKNLMPRASVILVPILHWPDFVTILRRDFVIDTFRAKWYLWKWSGNIPLPSIITTSITIIHSLFRITSFLHCAQMRHLLSPKVKTYSVNNPLWTLAICCH